MCAGGRRERSPAFARGLRQPQRRSWPQLCVKLAQTQALAWELRPPMLVSAAAVQPSAAPLCPVRVTPVPTAVLWLLSVAARRVPSLESVAYPHPLQVRALLAASLRRVRKPEPAEARLRVSAGVREVVARSGIRRRPLLLPHRRS